MSQPEINDSVAGQIKDRREQGQGVRSEVMASLLGVDAGMRAGVLAPGTIAGRALNQETSWTYAPEVIKDSPIAESLFTIAEVLTPTLITAGLAPGLSTAPGFVVAESAIETAISTETNDDLMAGRTLAAAVGEVAEYLQPGSGEQLARDLVEGKTVNSQVLITVAGFLQNLGINIVNQLLAPFVKPYEEGSVPVKRNAGPQSNLRRRQVLPRDFVGYRAIKEEVWLSGKDTPWGQETATCLQRRLLLNRPCICLFLRQEPPEWETRRHRSTHQGHHQGRAGRDRQRKWRIQ